MEFRDTGPDSLNFLDLDIASEIANLETTTRTLEMGWGINKGSGVDAQGGPAAPRIVGHNPGGYQPVGGTFGGFGSLDASALRGLETWKTSPNANTQNMLTLAQNSSRAARNGREQQRAQKISEFIDKLKGIIDRANVTSGDSTSKLSVLTRCEGYIRSLQDRTKCYELEARLRSIARGGQANPHDGFIGATGGNDIDWSKTADDLLPSEDSRNGETDNLDNTSSARENGSSSSSSSGSVEDVKPFSDVKRPASSRERRSEEDGDTGSTAQEEDGDTGSTDSAEQRSADATDSASQGFTTDTASRGFGTDSGYAGSSLSGDSGSADSGDAGSADGGSEGSEEGVSRSRMRVANYFDIFRLSNVPMAIADKEGTLVDVNDAMRGFGRINDETVKTLTVKSLVASESAKALEEAMTKMLATETAPEELPVLDSGLPPGGTQPFLVNASIGDRPTHLTLSLVYDEHGEASAFHIALIPRTPHKTGSPFEEDSCSPPRRVEYSGESSALAPGEVRRWAGGGQRIDVGVGEGVSGSSLGEGSTKRSAGCWAKNGRTAKSQKR